MNTRYIAAAIILFAMAGSSAIAQPDIYLSFSDFGDGNASTNNSRFVVDGDSESVFVWVDENFIIEYGACLDLDVTSTGTIEITGVEVFNPDVVIAGTTVVVGQRWEATSNGINMTVDSVDNFCGVAVTSGFGINPDLIVGGGGVFEDTLHDPLSNGFLFARIDFNAIGNGSVDMVISEADGGILGPPVIDFGSASINVVPTNGAGNYFGLAFDPLGEAILVYDEQAVELAVENTSSSGKDGVQIELGATDGYGIDFTTESPEFMDENAYIELTTIGTLNDQPDVEISTVKMARVIGDEDESDIGVSLETALPASSLVVEAWLNGVVVDTHTFTSFPAVDDVIFRTRPPAGASTTTWKVEKGESVVANEVFYQWVLEDAYVTTIGPNTEVLADEVVIILPDSASAMNKAELIDAIAKDVGLMRVRRISLSTFGTFQTALGNAILTADNEAGTLTVSNIGPSGLDGVSTDLGNVETAGYTFEDLETNGPYGVGAQLSFSVRGDRDGVPDTQLGTLRFTETATGEKDITADYPQSSTYLLIVRNNGSTVATIPGHTGLVATVPNWPGNCTKSVVWNDFDLDCIKTCWEQPLTFNIPGPGPGPIVGDELLVLAETGTPIDSLSELQLTANDIPSITLTNIDAYILGDVNRDGNINLLDIDPFIERIGTGTYQVEADCNQDGTINLLDIDPFIAILGGG